MDLVGRIFGRMGMFMRFTFWVFVGALLFRVFLMVLGGAVGIG